MPPKRGTPTCCFGNIVQKTAWNLQKNELKRGGVPSAPSWIRQYNDTLKAPGLSPSCHEVVARLFKWGSVPRKLSTIARGSNLQNNNKIRCHYQHLTVLALCTFVMYKLNFNWIQICRVAFWVILLAILVKLQKCSFSKISESAQYKRFSWKWLSWFDYLPYPEKHRTKTFIGEQ